MPAEIRPITIEQGATFTLAFQWLADSLATPGTPGLPIPLTGATVRMQVRKKQGTTVLAEATSPSDGIILAEADGRVTITLTPAKTNLLISKQCLYDVEVEFSADEVHRLVEGPATIRPNITQAPGDPVVLR